MKKRLSEIEADGKTVLLRTDFNVPIKKGKVLDNTKIKKSLKTIKYLLKKNCHIIVISHLGRPKKKDKKYSLKPVEKELFRLLKIKKHKKLVLMENLRFHPGEVSKSQTFAKKLAGLAELFVFDAFGVSHHPAASVTEVPKYLPSVSGFLLEEELEKLSLALKSKRPSIWIIGGAKLDKVDLFSSALKKADKILVGGALMFSFLKAKGYFVGHSKYDLESVRIAKKILKKKNSKKIILPVDCLIAKDLKGKASIVDVDSMPNDSMGLDIGPKTIKLFKRHVGMVKTIVWNGPMGVFEIKKYAKGTNELAKKISSSHAVSIIGGGETADAVKKFTFTHVSTGGGASLAYLSGKKLPAVTALEKSYKKFRKLFS